MPGITARQSQYSLIRELLDKPQNYSYGMVIKLLCGYFGENTKLTTHPELTLAFNASDVSSITIYDLANQSQTIDGRCIEYTKISPSELFAKLNSYKHSIEQVLALGLEESVQNEELEKLSYLKPKISFDIGVNFLGLYGSSSPLPIYYTEGIIRDESEDNFSTSDFLNVLNSPIYTQYHTAWRKYSIFQRLVEDKDTFLIERIFCFAGLSLPKIREQNLNMFDVLPYLGVFSMIPRSAEGLKAILHGEFGNKISVDQFTVKWMAIPPEQLMSLGEENSTLGEDSYLGTSIKTTDGSIKINIECNDFKQYSALMPDQLLYNKLKGLLGLYMMDRIEIMLHISLNNSTPSSVCLGDENILGISTYLYGEQNSKCMSFSLPLHY